MDTASTNWWQMGMNGVLNLAQGGAFGSDVAKYSGKIINQKTATAAPAVAPPPAPVAGQQSVNPTAAPSGGGFAAHFAANWGKYALGLGALVVVIVGAKLARR